MPFIKKKFGTYQAFAKASVKDIYGDSLKTALKYEANWMQSTLFLGKDNGAFEVIPLPASAQKSAVQGIDLVDIDGDKIPELLLAGNLYHTEVETARMDASVGTIFSISGKGNMKEIALNQSGWFANGDIKSLKVIDGIQDFKLILTSANSGRLRMFVVNQK